MRATVIFSFLASICFVVSGALYVRDIASKKVTPNIASFLIWSFSSISQLIALIVEQVWHVVPFMAIISVINILVVILSYRQRKFYFKALDKLALIIALIAMVAWFITKDAAWNIYIISLSTGAAFVPIIVKSFKHPNLETIVPWRYNLIGSAFLVLAIPSFALIQWIVPARQLIAALLIYIGLSRGELKRQRTK